MNKKIFAILILGIFLLSFASASIDYIKENETYVVDSFLPIWLGGEGESRVELVYNTDQCLINCEAILKFNNEEPVILTDDIKFINNKGSNIRNNIIDLEFLVGKYEDVEKINYSSPIYSSEKTCNQFNYTNGTNNENCYYEILDYEKYYSVELIWRNYNGSKESGESFLKIRGKKDPLIRADWIITFRGKDLIEWAWWDSDWRNKRQINLTSSIGNISYIEKINYSANMKSDFSDLRFTDSTETIELNYTIRKKVDSDYIIVSIFSRGENQIYMYYGNSLASSNSNASAVYFNSFSGYYLDEDVTDFNNIYNGTNSGAIPTIGYINNSYEFTSSGHISIDNNPMISASSGSVSLWINTDTVSAQKVFIASGLSSSTGAPYFFLGINNDELYLSANTGVNNVEGTVGAGLLINTWYHVTILNNASGNHFFINGVIQGKTLIVGTAGKWFSDVAGTDTFSIGAVDRNGDYAPWDGELDEIYFSNSEYSKEEIMSLYTQTAPGYSIGAEEVNQGVNTVLIIPGSSSIFTTELINFSFSSIPVFDNLTNSTLYLWNNTDNSLILTNFTTLSGNETINTTFTNNLNQGLYKWNVESCSENAGCSFANINFSFTIHTTNPSIKIIYPNETLNYILLGTNETLNYSISETGENISHFEECWFEYNDTEVLNNISFNGVDEWSFSSNYANVTKISVIEAPNNLIEFDSIPEDCSKSGNFSLKATGFLSPSKNVYSCKDLDNNDLTIGESNPRLGQAILSNITAMQKRSLNCSGNAKSFEYVLNKNSLSVHSIDEFGFHSQNSTDWNYKIIELNKTFQDETIEGSSEDFYIYLQKASGVSVQSIILNYDGQAYSSSLFSSGNNVYALSEVLIPSVSVDENKTFYFIITLSDSTVLNSSFSTQLIQNIEIDDCSSQPNLFLNLSLVDEETQVQITGDIEVFLSVINSENYGEVLNFSGNYSSISNKGFCSNLKLNETDFLLNGEIRYSSQNHSAEFYNIQKSELLNYPKEFILYDLALDDSTRFKLIYKGDDLVGVEGAIIQLLRKYISEGVYKVVEAPLTSSESTALVHVDTNTNKYDANVVKDGVLLNKFENLVFICQSELTGECTLNLLDFITPPTSVSIDTIQDFSYSLSSSIDNKTITIDYSVPSGTTSTIRVVADQTDIIGEENICNTTVSSAGGSIECAYNDSIQDSTIKYFIYKDNQLITQKSFVVKDDLRDDFQGDNYFILIIFTISLIFMGMLSTEYIIINSIISIIIGGATWLIRGMDFVLGLGAIAWLILAGIIIIIKQSEKEDL